ncbi:MAG: DHH family phosphoesterase [Candidatus Diapherotrites archaeon]|uniref:DHH family phosphoesterase n=1 Tax=Candidatus Iainarchaeum sp. TaxID=3101447 RepID=A0A8T4LFD1_9ARCH|nr:DHH family phosphoesterase [Candidatus Diapherotrites archaeon]
MQKSKILKRFDLFLKALSKNDRVGLWVHCDGDGLMSGAIAAKAVESLIGKRPDIFFCSGYPNQDGLMRKISVLKDRQCNKVLILDLSLDQDDFVIKNLEPFAEVLFVDHHKVYNDFNSEKTVFIKAEWIAPKGMDPSKYPASKMAFDLFSRQVDLSSSSWLCCIGLYADCANGAWKTFFDSELKKSKTDLDAIKKSCQVIDAVGIIDNSKFSELYRLFLDASGTRDILASDFFGLAKDLEEEMDYWLLEFKKKAEFFPEIELVWFVFHPRFPIKSPFINKISFDFYPNQTVVLVQLLDGMKTANFSGRRQDGKVRVNDLLEESVKGIENASAGGHAPAAAGKVSRENLELFKNNLLSELRKRNVAK